MSNNPEFKKTRVLWGLAVFLFLIGVDQLAKNTAGDIFRNYFFAFSLQIPQPAMYAIYLVGIAAIAFYLYKHVGNLAKHEFLVWVMVLAGAVSNIGERVALGYVRDWIYIGNGVFNLADGYIIAGIVLLLVGGAQNSKLQMPNIK